MERHFDHSAKPVTCRFFRPTLEPGGEYKCRWSIDWGDREQRRSARGIDAVQALMLAMRSVHTELIHSEAYLAGELTYLDERDLDLPPAFTFGGGSEQSG